MSRSFRNAPNDHRSLYPRLLGTRGAIASESHLATKAGAEMLDAGGNAVDAVVAAVLMENLVDPHMNGFGGECPILVRMAESGEVVSINGNMAAPALATPEAFKARGLTDLPDEGILAAGVPATFGALLEVLTRWGRLSFAEVSAPALRAARDGFPLHAGLLGQEKFGLRDLAEKFGAQWPGSAALFLREGAAPAEGDLQRNPAVAALLDHLGNEEHKGADRAAGLARVRDGFYRGEVAAAIDAFSRERDGLLRREDLAAYETWLEEPTMRRFAGAELYKCGFWNQGPTVLQALAILERFDLKAMGHNSADYLHTVIEAVKLVYADREQYYGDPRRIEVPAEALLSDAYAALRAALIDPGRADAEIRPGDPVGGAALLPSGRRLGGALWGPGTVHVSCIDAEGNLVAATPSGGWLKSAEVIPALGFPLGNRMMTFYLDPPHHPNVVAPGKRPRTTISPSLATRDGAPWMVFGTMGGDQQDQWMLQFFLNRALFGMSLQQAIEAPKFSSEHFPGFFAPHDFFLNQVRIEPRVGESVMAELERRGHGVARATDWTEGFMLACERHPDGVLEAACDPRGTRAEIFNAFAMAW